MKEEEYRKIFEELWDAGTLPDEQMETIDKLIKGKLKIDMNNRWNIQRLTYTKEYYLEQIKKFDETFK